MASIRIQYFGTLRAAAAKAEETYDLAPETSLSQLLQQLASIYDIGFSGEIFATNPAEPIEILWDSLRSDIMVMLNDKAVAHNHVAEILLQDGDRIALFPLFPGGG
ncbi:MAG: MoaD/ThiS family protein [Symbiobacteriaceae bacterium]|nr:MoaD/ThiS family protein [Symbiobacteriaceae bacterium]